MRRSFVSVIAGLLLAAGLTLGTRANAACQGYCADLRPGGWTFAGCSLELDQNDQVVAVSCAYAKVTIVN